MFHDFLAFLAEIECPVTEIVHLDNNEVFLRFGKKESADIFANLPFPKRTVREFCFVVGLNVCNWAEMP